jgi:hypothetical protein
MLPIGRREGRRIDAATRWVRPIRQDVARALPSRPMPYRAPDARPTRASRSITGPDELSVRKRWIAAACVVFIVANFARGGTLVEGSALVALALTWLALDAATRRFAFSVEGDEIVLDGYFQDNPMPRNYDGAPAGYERMMSYLDQKKMGCHLHRWRFNLKTGQTTEKRLDERILEFGMFNQRYATQPYRYAYSAVQVPGWFLFHGYVKHDLQTGQSWEIRLPEGQYASEAPFAPRVNAQDEDDGYLVSFITNEKTQRSEIILIDSKKFEAGPVCRIELPHKLCSGTHACWASGADMERGGLLSGQAH